MQSIKSVIYYVPETNHPCSCCSDSLRAWASSSLAVRTLPAVLKVLESLRSVNDWTYYNEKCDNCNITSITDMLLFVIMIFCQSDLWKRARQAEFEVACNPLQLKCPTKAWRHSYQSL